MCVCVRVTFIIDWVEGRFLDKVFTPQIRHFRLGSWEKLQDNLHPVPSAPLAMARRQGLFDCAPVEKFVEGPGP